MKFSYLNHWFSQQKNVILQHTNIIRGNMETKPLNRIKVVMAERMVSNKELSEIHSGNINYFKLPCKLPSYSFLRERID